ncbi:MAG TPA: class I SAM-dependent methyltransferase [Bacteroidales bacterium]|nr:class I SAM-dependent methyltransferase [Bacteroidales bacterium]
MAVSQKKVWNQIAYDKEFTTPLHLELIEPYLHKNSSILDVGCGYGRTLNELYKNGYTELFGIDFSEKMIERAQQQFPFLNVKVQQQQEIDFPNNSFDAVFLFAVLTCIIENEAQLFLLKEIKRVLKPKGIIYVNDFLLNTDERNKKRYNESYEKYKTYGIFTLPEGLVLRHHTLDWVEKSLQLFQCLSFQTTTFPTMNGNRSNAYFFIGKNIHFF